jgi:uncharacterized protein with NAD-binding domain and iron-sulfur cluster
VAVVGAGVAGLTAAYLLQRQFDVTLYEAQSRLGGHAHTHEVLSADGRVLPIDSGFIVCNNRTYPYLLRLFGELGVETQPTEMSLSMRHPNYFGDATVWWGLWLIAAQQWAGVFTILSPLLMTWTLTRKTGKPLLEQGMAERRPGYADYVARTSGFFPLPPKRAV